MTRNGAMDEAEVEVEAEPATCRAIGEEVQSSFGVRVSVRGVPPRSLPRWEHKAKRFLDLRD